MIDLSALLVAGRIRIPVPVPREYFWVGLGAIILLNSLIYIIHKAFADAEVRRKKAALDADLHQAAEAVMILMMAADGRIEESEIKVIQGVYRQLAHEELPKERISRRAEELKRSSTDMHRAVRRIAPNLAAGGKELLLKAALFVAASDGKLQEQETDRLLELAQALKMPPQQFNSVLAEFLQAG
jgi:tellurite resistance protein